MRALLQVDTFIANVANYDSVNNKNSEDIKLGNCIVRR